MSYRSGWIQAGIAGAVLTGAALVSSNVLAQDATSLGTIGAVPTQAGCCEGGSATAANAWTTGNYTSDYWPSTVIEPASGWWTHGDIEVGGRDFVSNPARDGSGIHNGNVWQQGNNLAKFYEYSSTLPGAFGGGHVAAGTKDGLYQIDLWANNVGYDDQSYYLNASKIGEQYLSLQWDQTPHLYSTTAQTPYNGVGTTNLTVPAQAGAMPGIVPELHQADIGIHRDTASVNYRWTPTEAWDFNVDYSHLSRTGTQALGGVIGLPAGSPNYTMIATPVSDSTQNYGATGEYAGTSPWGKNYTVKLGYKGSTYHDDSLSYTIESPLTVGIPIARESMWPSNQANGFVGTVAADLPMQSRYVGTVNYTSMTQNSPFIPMSANFAGLAPSVNPLPANSLDGEINTILSNNVLTTKITPELTSKLTYRYYNFDNRTPQILFTQWISDDAAAINEKAFQTLTMSYTKQDASGSLNWRPSEAWNFNAAYNFERYGYKQADANGTDENSVKLSADYKPTSWLTARTSGSYGYRYYDIYDYKDFVFSIQNPLVPLALDQNWGYSSAYRQFMFDNRGQTKAQFSLDVVAFPKITISPTIKYEDDHYNLNPTYEDGITDNKSLGWGVDTSYAASRDFLFVLSYYRQYYNMAMYNLNVAHGAACATAPSPATSCVPGSAGTSQYSSVDNAIADTISAGVNYAAIPDKLDIDLHLALSKGNDQERLWYALGPAAVTFPTLGNDRTWFTHLDASATYKFDPETVNKLGWKGDLKAKLRYTWESNTVANWQNDSVVPFSTAQGANLLFMASDNPNYNIQMIAASLIASW